MELSTTGHPGRTPYTPSIPMRREPSDLGLACQTIMGEPDVEQPGFIVSGLCSSVSEMEYISCKQKSHALLGPIFSREPYN